MLKKIRLSSTNKRSARATINIALSFLIKGWAGGIQLLLVPLILACLGEYMTGVWLTISSMLLWMDSFDFGLGNGLRNKLAESVALDNWNEARRAVSTTFIIMLILIVPLTIIILTVLFNVDAYKILNIDVSRLSDLYTTLTTTIIIVAVTFVFKIIGNIYLGLQLPAVNNLLVVAGQSLGALAIFILHQCYGELSLLQVAVASTGATVLIYMIAYPVTFHYYPELKPSWKLFDKKMLNILLSKGLMFFILQISGIVLFMSSNILISNLLSPAEVTPYQVVYRYFSFVTMLFSIFVTPLWAATTDAYTKRDFDWIRGVTRRMYVLLALFAVLISVMLVLAPYVYEIWVGKDLYINPLLSCMMAVYIMIIIYSLYFAHILFGIGHIRVQTYTTLIEAICFFPLAYVGAKLWGTPGILAALLFVNLFCAVTNTIQYKKIISGKASGIWLK